MSNLKRHFVAVALGVSSLLVLGASGASAEWDVVHFNGGTYSQDGSSYSQAGGHPYSIITVSASAPSKKVR